MHRTSKTVRWLLYFSQEFLRKICWIRINCLCESAFIRIRLAVFMISFGIEIFKVIAPARIFLSITIWRIFTAADLSIVWVGSCW